MHKLLARQLSRATRASGEIDFDVLLELVEAAYVEADRERDRLDRAALLTCEEMDQLNDELRQLAHHDPLTGLPNRLLFADFAGRAVQRAKLGERFAVLLIDLDRFKAVNDTYGHAMGDALLRQVAARLRATVRAGDEVARTGGDEFAVIQYGAEADHCAESTARRLVSSLNAPYPIGGRILDVGASVGVAVAGLDTEDVDTLLRQADVALYRAKNDGRCTWRVFEPGMESRAPGVLESGGAAAWSI